MCLASLFGIVTSRPNCEQILSVFRGIRTLSECCTEKPWYVRYFRNVWLNSAMRFPLAVGKGFQNRLYPNLDQLRGGRADG